MKKGVIRETKLFRHPIFISKKSRYKTGVIPRYKTGVIPRIKRRVKFLVGQGKLLSIWFGKITVEYAKQLSDYPGFKIRFYPDQEK